MDHKNRGYDTLTFGAPITINGVRHNMAVVVRLEGKNYYKLHKVILPNGSMLTYINEKSTAERAGATEVVTSPTDNAFDNSILDSNKKVNSFNKNSIKFSLKDGKSRTLTDGQVKKKLAD